MLIGFATIIRKQMSLTKRNKYRYNPETLSYEKIKRTPWQIITTIIVHLFSGTSIGIITFFLAAWIADSPEEKQLRLENRRIEIEYKRLCKKVDEMNNILEDLRQRDNNLYRVMLMADSIPESVRRSPKSNESYENFARTSRIVAQTEYKVDDLAKQIYTQSKSYDEIVNLLKTNEDKLMHIPAIQPVLNKDLKKLASGYGWRIDPVYHTRKMHHGMDFTAPVGTDVYATGDGTVSYVGWKQGYGNTVIINHGFGYATLYAHLSKALVKNGQKVSRADVIALVGNTGKSTGPHLHYEVHYKGEPVNPMNYYFIDLTPEQYDEMIQIVRNAGQVLD